MKTLTLQSPAKLNIYLKVLNKQKDGFHEIKTIFQRINLFDELVFKSNDSGKIKIQCNHPHVPVGSKNLVSRVVRFFQEKYHISKGMDIKITKNIPVAAGLAGGSTNAATTLLAVNKLWGLKLTVSQLVTIGRTIGSDVPFFLHNCSWGLGTGRGDKIKKLDISTQLWQIIVVPKIKMYSSKVYGAMNLKLTKKGDNVNILLRNLKDANTLEVGQLLENDLEIPIIKLCPRLQKLKERLKLLNPQGVMISGSGPSVFGITQNEQEARQIAREMSKRFAQVFVVKTL
jgi:4-diphosphocytidyl-2-C-methyl-D-erythritol kinase